MRPLKVTVSREQQACPAQALTATTSRHSAVVRRSPTSQVARSGLETRSCLPPRGSSTASPGLNLEDLAVRLSQIRVTLRDEMELCSAGDGTKSHSKGRRDLDPAIVDPRHSHALEQFTDEIRRNGRLYVGTTRSGVMIKHCGQNVIDRPERPSYFMTLMVTFLKGSSRMSNSMGWEETLRAEARPRWDAVFATALGVFGLVTAEFLPASLLTPIAGSLGVSEGTAGQTVTATAVVALASSLLTALGTRRIDRRYVLLSFSVLLIASNVVVALAGSLPVLLLGRVLLGVAIGGFWTMSAAVAMRLVPEARVARALSVIFSGVSAATILAAPVGSYLGHLLGWREVFMLAAGLGVLALLAQAATLPRMAANEATRLSTMGEVLRRPEISVGMIAALLVFAGHFAFFTYVRPFLETVADVGANALSAILLGFGVANFVGTLLAGPLLERNLRLTLLAMPLLMAAIGLVLVGLGAAPAADAVLVSLWGLAFGAVPVAWSTWLTRVAPDRAETAGGLLVAAIQLAISLGASVGGSVFDVSGATGVFSASTAALALACLVIVAGVRPRCAQCAA